MIRAVLSLLKRHTLCDSLKFQIDFHQTDFVYRTYVICYINNVTLDKVNTTHLAEMCFTNLRVELPAGGYHLSVFDLPRLAASYFC